MPHPSDSPSRRKPDKPYPEYPLTPRRDGRWYKRVYGKFYYFTGTAEEALAKYEALLEGASEAQGALQIRDLCERFMVTRQTDLDAGQITGNTFADYHKACDRIVAFFGRLRPLDGLTRQDAEAFRAHLVKKVSVKTQMNRITLARMVFYWGHEQEMIPKQFHKWIKTVSKDQLKRHRSKQPKRTMTAEEIQRLLKAASIPMKAMLLLAINCGFGNSDCGELTHEYLDLDGGWHDFPRPKTGESRRAKLWPETVDALRVAISRRPVAKDPEHANRVFLSAWGTPWVKPCRHGDLVGKTFTRLARKVGVKRPGVSFYTLRHMHETVAGGTRDQVAVNVSMGHADPSMAANYRQHIDDDRLAAVADHVHRWLFGAPMGDGRKRLRVVG